MDKIIERLRNIVEKSDSFYDAMKRVSADLGITHTHSIDIVNNLPNERNITSSQFRLAITSMIVRHFEPRLQDPKNKDINKIKYFKAVYKRLGHTNLLNIADMQSYHTMMFLIQTKPSKTNTQKSKIKKNTNHVNQLPLGY